MKQQNIISLEDYPDIDDDVMYEKIKLYEKRKKEINEKYPNPIPKYVKEYQREIRKMIKEFDE